MKWHLTLLLSITAILCTSNLSYSAISCSSLLLEPDLYDVMERSRELYLESPTEVNLLTHLFATSDLLTSNGVSHKLYEQSIEILPSSNTALNRFSRKAHRLSQVTVSYSPLRIRESGAHAMFAFDVAPDKSQIPLELLISADFILINRVSDADAHEWVHLLQLNYSSKRRSQGNIFNADFRTVRELFAFDEIRAYFTSASVILNDFKRGFLTNMMKEEFGSILKSLTIYLNAYQGGGGLILALYIYHLTPVTGHVHIHNTLNLKTAILRSQFHLLKVGVSPL